MKDNLIKRASKALGLTYKELASKIGYKADTINKVASVGEISDSMIKAIELYVQLESIKQNKPELLKILSTDDSIEEENLIKIVCDELKMTYKELGEAIGYSEGALKTAVSTGKISKSMIKAIELYKKTLELEKEIDKYENMKKFISDFGLLLLGDKIEKL